MSNDRAGDGNDNDKDAAVAKTAGFVVFSGIAMSILKALNPLNKPNLHNNLPTTTTTTTTNNNNNETKPFGESAQAVQQHQSVSPQEPIVKTPITSVEQTVPESSTKTIEIVKGDTLWGLSRQYGVSIEEIKEANGLTGDTIYAGKKLIIP